MSRLSLIALALATLIGLSISPRSQAADAGDGGP